MNSLQSSALVKMGRRFKRKCEVILVEVKGFLWHLCWVKWAVWGRGDTVELRTKSPMSGLYSPAIGLIVTQQ